MKEFVMYIWGVDIYLLLSAALADINQNTIEGFTVLVFINLSKKIT
jgi:hypothetical protein